MFPMAFRALTLVFLTLSSWKDAIAEMKLSTLQEDRSDFAAYNPVNMRTDSAVGVLATNATNRRFANQDRRLATYYFSLTMADLGGPNPDAAIGNPLKGLLESPFYLKPPYTADIPPSLEFYYIGK